MSYDVSKIRNDFRFFLIRNLQDLLQILIDIQLIKQEIL